MAEVTREQILAGLKEGWGTYIDRYCGMAPEARAEFLQNQGYARLADLLGHIIAWWEEGIVAVRRLAHNPDTDLPDYDVDGFNFKAVRRFKSNTDEDLIQKFEALREEFIRTVEILPEEAFEGEAVPARLQVEVLGHLSEHQIPGL